MYAQTSPVRPHVVSLSPDRIALRLSGTVALLLAAHLIGLVFRYRFGHPSAFGLVPLFDFWAEANVPTFFTACLLLANACLFRAFSALVPLQRDRRFWTLAGAVTAFLAVDEIAGVHERLNDVLSPLHLEGPLYFAWILPYSIATIAFCGLALPAWLRLDRGDRVRMAFALITYVAGAVGFEALEGLRRTATGVDRELGIDLLVTLEETLEMLGVCLLTHALLRAIQSLRPSFVVRLEVDWVRRIEPLPVQGVPAQSAGSDPERG